MMKPSGVSIFYIVLLIHKCMSGFYPPLFWHQDNCAFRKLQESTNTNITKEYYINVLPYNGMNVVCPNHVTVNTWLSEDALSMTTKMENMWMVDKEGYDKCMVNGKGDPKINKRILVCDDPKKLKYKMFGFHPRYNSVEPKFAPGQHYYFISTSRGYRHELYTRNVSGPQGSCERYHMKLHIYVCDTRKEDCVWEMPHCDPPKELYKEMLLINGKLPAPTQPAAVRPKTQITKKARTTTTPNIPPKKPKNLHKEDPEISVQTTPPSENGLDHGNPKPLCVKKKKGTSVQLILNFVLGGVALFMAVVIIILVCGLSRKSKDYDMDRPVSTISSIHEGNRYVYTGTLRNSDGHEIALMTRTPPRSPNVITGPFVQMTPQANKPELTPLVDNGNRFVFPKRRRHSFDGVTTTA